jgi:hypothetical protein
MVFGADIVQHLERGVSLRVDGKDVPAFEIGLQRIFELPSRCFHFGNAALAHAPDVVSLFNGMIPLIAIQLQALKFGDQGGLIGFELATSGLPKLRSKLPAGRIAVEKEY